MQRYTPDFLVRLDDGRAEPLNLVLEVKGLLDDSDKVKAEVTHTLCVFGVNALGRFGRWGRADFRVWTTMEKVFVMVVERLLGRRP